MINKIIICVIFILTTQIHANSLYYNDKVSQFKLLLNKKNKTIMMIGDSITDRGLWNEILDRNDIINRGINGDTTKGILNRLNQLNPSIKQAYIMIGINDILRDKSVPSIYNNYVKIIKILKQKNINPIIQSTLYIGQKSENIYNQKIKYLNNLLYSFAITNKILFINLNKKLAPNNQLLSKYTLDGLHLNGQGYIEWAKMIKYTFKE